MAKVIFIANSNLVQLLGHKSKASGGDYVNDAVVTATLLKNGDPVAGGLISLNYVPGSFGDYEGVLPSSLPLSATGYSLQVDAAQGGNPGFQKIIPIVSRVRGEGD